MSDLEKKLNRRSFFGFSFLTLASLPFLAKGTLFGQKALASDKGNAATKTNKTGGACPASAPAGKNGIDPESPAAKRLDFVMDASNTSHKAFKAGDNCDTCSFYRKEKEAGEWAPCTMLGLKFVPACGWCKSYKKKA